MSKISTRNHTNNGRRNQKETTETTKKCNRRAEQAKKDHTAHLLSVNPEFDEINCECWENGTHCESWSSCKFCESCKECERCEDCEDEFECCEECTKCEACELLNAEKEASPEKKSRKNGKVTKAERSKDIVDEVYDYNDEPKKTKTAHKQRFFMGRR